MELFIKVIGIAFVAIAAFSILKTTQPPIGRFIPIAAGCLILVLLAAPISTVIRTAKDIGSRSGISSTVFTSLLKIIGIGYLTEFAVSLCNDSDSASLGKKVELSGKITILLSSLPIISEIITLLEGLL